MEECAKVVTLQKKLTTRLRDVLDNDFENRSKAAEVAGKSIDALGLYLSEKSVPPFNTVAALANHAGVSLDWLATGKGNKYIKDTPILSADAFPINIYDVSISAGLGRINDDERLHSTLGISKEVATLYNIAPSCIGVFIGGDSMIPKLSNGDLAIIDLNINQLEDDGIYAFNYDNHCFVKQLQKVGKEIKVNSLNQDYESWTIASDEGFKIIGKLKLVIKKP